MCWDEYFTVHPGCVNMTQLWTFEDVVGPGDALVDSKIGEHRSVARLLSNSSKTRVWEVPANCPVNLKPCWVTAVEGEDNALPELNPTTQRRAAAVVPVERAVVEEVPGSASMNVDWMGARVAQEEARERFESNVGKAPDGSKLRELLSEFRHVLFAERIGCTHLAKFDIDVGQSAPVCQRDRRWSYKELQAMKAEVEMMVKKGYIEPSSSPWAARLVMVPKTDGQIRVCVDFRAVNKLVTADAYPAPQIAQTLISYKVHSGSRLWTRRRDTTRFL